MTLIGRVKAWLFGHKEEVRQVYNERQEAMSQLHETSQNAANAAMYQSYCAEEAHKSDREAIHYLRNMRARREAEAARNPVTESATEAIKRLEAARKAQRHK